MQIKEYRGKRLSMCRVSTLLPVMLGLPHLLDIFVDPTLLNFIRAVLVLALIVAGFSIEKYAYLGYFSVLFILGIWQIISITKLPENTGYSPIFLLAPWILYHAAKSKEVPLKMTILLATLSAAGSYFSPFMWRIAEFSFGYGLKRATGLDAVYILITHWLTVLVSVLLGFYFRARQDARDLEKQQIRDEERRLIAVEIHDLLAHSLTLIKIQASAGLYDPSQASSALATIQTVAGEGIHEVRTLISSLQGSEANFLNTLPDIVERFRVTGMDINAEMADISALMPSTQLAAQRVLIETLTNASKHQDKAHITIRIICDNVLRMCITSYGRISSGSLGNKIGLESLNERCIALGGSFDFQLSGDTATTTAIIPVGRHEHKDFYRR